MKSQTVCSTAQCNSDYSGYWEMGEFNLCIMKTPELTKKQFDFVCNLNQCTHLHADAYMESFKMGAV